MHGSSVTTTPHAIIHMLGDSYSGFPSLINCRCNTSMSTDSTTQDGCEFGQQTYNLDRKRVKGHIRYSSTTKNDLRIKYGLAISTHYGLLKTVQSSIIKCANDGFPTNRYALLSDILNGNCITITRRSGLNGETYLSISNGFGQLINETTLGGW